MDIIVNFSEGSLPATGKNPILSSWTTDGSLVISGETMSEIGNGFYKYSFSGYDYEQDYIFTAYESTLPLGEQYYHYSNDVDSSRNQGVLKAILALVGENTRTTNTMYDSNGNLLQANLYTYSNAADCSADTNRLNEYAITATYAGNNLQTYRCEKL